VKPAPFRYHAPASLDEALALLAELGPDARPLAGGQSLVPAMNFRLAQPAVLVDLNGIADLAGVVEENDGGLRIGAMTRQRTLERHPVVAARAPLLAEATAWVAHPPIRNRGTLGGSLAHADPAAELPAVMLALDARFRLVSRAGERWVDAADFFPGFFATALDSGELLVEVALPPAGGGWSSAFEELARRHGDYALAGVAARIHRDEAGRCTDARVALLALGEGPARVAAAEGTLVGSRLEVDALAAAARAVQGQVDPPGDIHASAEYRRHLAGVLTRRALARAAGMPPS
jgi:carbon-monoxide dehydrogenase medium subunit